MKCKLAKFYTVILIYLFLNSTLVAQNENINKPKLFNYIGFNSSLFQLNKPKINSTTTIDSNLSFQGGVNFQSSLAIKHSAIGIAMGMEAFSINKTIVLACPIAAVFTLMNDKNTLQFNFKIGTNYLPKNRFNLTRANFFETGFLYFPDESPAGIGLSYKNYSTKFNIENQFNSQFLNFNINFTIDK